MEPPRRGGNGRWVAVRAHHYCLSADLEPLLQLDELLRRVVMGSTLHLELQLNRTLPGWSSRWSAWIALRLERYERRVRGSSVCARAAAAQRARLLSAAVLVESRR